MEYLHIDGVRLEYYHYGPAPQEAPTLVFLHEGLGCVALWRDFPARLADATGCGALVYSRRGYGGSDPCQLPRPTSYLQDEGLQVLPRVMDAAGVGDCVLIGHSDGGTIALIHAGSGKDGRVRGVVTEAAHVFNEELGLRSIHRTREAFLKGTLREKLARHHGANVDCAFWGWCDAWLSPEFEHWNIEQCLPAITAPLLAIQGMDDEYGTGAQPAAIAAGAGGKARILMLEGCGHAPHRELEEVVLGEMARFVGEALGK